MNWPASLSCTIALDQRLRLPAKLIMLAHEEVDADDRKYGENEGLEQTDTEKTWHRCDHGLNQTSHALQLMQRA